MKKVRILMNVLAFVFAIGAAYASAKSPSIQGYKFVSVGQACAISVQCSGEGQTCMDASEDVAVPVWNDDEPNGPTSCGTLLKHTP